MINITFDGWGYWCLGNRFKLFLDAFHFACDKGWMGEA